MSLNQERERLIWGIKNEWEWGKILGF